MYFPQSSMRRARPSKQTQKLFFYPFSRKRRLIWSIRIMSQELDKNYWLSRCGQAERCSSSADSIKWRVDQRFVPSMTTCSSTVILPQQSNRAQHCVTGCHHPGVFIGAGHSRRYVLFGVLSTARLQLGFVAVSRLWIQTEKWPPSPYVWLHLRPKQWYVETHIQLKQSKHFVDHISLETFVFYCLTSAVKKKALPISLWWAYDIHKAQEHHPVSNNLKCIPLSSIISSYRPPKTCITCSYWSTVGMTY